MESEAIEKLWIQLFDLNIIGVSVNLLKFKLTYKEFYKSQ